MKETLKEMRSRIGRMYSEGETKAIIRLIFYHLKGWSLTDMAIHADDELSPFIRNEIETILKRLENHEPIQYITGNAYFHGLTLKVAPGVLIPRPETAELVDIIADSFGEREDLKVLDVGTGSGAIAIALSRQLKFPEITAVDISEKALEIARTNASLLKAKIKFIHLDILKDFPEGSFDIVVSNPPYVTVSEKSAMEKNVLDYEPEEALFVADENPLLFYRRIIEQSRESINKDGGIFLEINPLFADDIARLLKNNGYKEVEILLDSFGRKRFAKALAVKR